MIQQYVIDANILFSAFISGKELYNSLFSAYTIFLPDFAFHEIEKYRKRILKKTKLSNQEFQEFVIMLLKNVTVVPGLLISQTSLKYAYDLCLEIDEKDTMYVAVAIELGINLITNDKRLYEGLKGSNFHNVILFGDLINQLPPLEKIMIS